MGRPLHDRRDELEIARMTVVSSPEKSITHLHAATEVILGPPLASTSQVMQELAALFDLRGMYAGCRSH